VALGVQGSLFGMSAICKSRTAPSTITRVKRRSVVHRRHAEAIRLQTRSVIESAEQASTKSAVLAETYDEMEKYLAEWSRAASRRSA